jgi:hypothetical protein
MLGVLLFAAVLTRFDMIRHHFRIAGVKEAVLSERASEIYLKERKKQVKTNESLFPTRQHHTYDV